MKTRDAEEAANALLATLDKMNKALPRLNVMVLGKTGVGKSTLINNMFGERLADVGIGKPVTNSITRYEKEDFPLTIYDTPGLELDGDNSLEEIYKEITDCISDGVKKAKRTGDMDHAVHCVWYCVNSASHRFEEAEKNFITRITAETRRFDVPVIIVMTQSFLKRDTKELAQEIEKEDLGAFAVIPVLAEDYEIDEDYTVKAYGLAKLARTMDEVIPSALKETLAAVQKVSIRLKVTRATAIVTMYAAAATALARAVVVPYVDQLILYPKQIKMLAHISSVFGVNLSDEAAGAIAGTVIGDGKKINKIKGPGHIATAVLTGSIAAGMTTTLGNAYISTMVAYAKGEITEEEIGGYYGLQCGGCCGQDHRYHQADQ